MPVTARAGHTYAHVVCMVWAQTHRCIYGTHVIQKEREKQAFIKKSDSHPHTQKQWFSMLENENMNGSVASVSVHRQKAVASPFPHADIHAALDLTKTTLLTHIDRSSLLEAGLQRGAALGCLFHSGILKECMNSVPKFGKGSWSWEFCNCFSIPWWLW